MVQVARPFSALRLAAYQGIGRPAGPRTSTRMTWRPGLPPPATTDTVNWLATPGLAAAGPLTRSDLARYGSTA